MGEEEKKISLLGLLWPCKHESCAGRAISLSDYCWRHTKDKQGYKGKIEEYVKEGESLEGFWLFEVNLQGALLPKANLCRAQLHAANLQKAMLAEANLQQAGLVEANLQGANLSHTNLQKAMLAGANLQGAMLWGANLQGAHLISANLTDVSWLTAGQLGSGVGEEEGDSYVNARETYLNLKNYFRVTGRYGDETWAFLKERKMERRRLFMLGFYGREKLSEELRLSARRRFWHWLTHYSRNWRAAIRYYLSETANLLCGYGEQPWKVLVSAVVIVAVFAGIYWVSGDIVISKDLQDLLGSPEQGLSVLDSMYFSVVTFTTLGFGDWRPNPSSWVRYVVMTQAFLGAFMMALFVFTFGKSVARR